MHTMSCLDDLITEYRLTVDKEIDATSFRIVLESRDDFLSLSYSTHPGDYPFHFDVRYCKQALFDRSFALYQFDTTGITTLWGFDHSMNTRIVVSLDEDRLVIADCCARTKMMFERFAKMSVEEYSIAYKEYSY
jgi:hypothetical protein